MKVGDITLHAVEAVVLEGDGLKVALLGTSFLNRTKIKWDGQIDTAALSTGCPVAVGRQ